jgi:metacaspase-1
MTTLQEYKNAEIKKLNTKYTIDAKKLLDIYNATIKRINNTRSYTMKMVVLYTKKANTDYKNGLLALKNKLAADKAKINALIKIPGNVSSPNNTVVVNNNRRALLMGLNYRNSSYELFGCINDAYSVEKKLRSSYGFTDVSIITDDTNIKPTANNIYNQIKELLQNSASGDLLFISYSGHGSYIMDTNGDENDGRDETLVGLDLIGVTDDSLKSLIDTHLKSGVTLIMLFDSCFSGTILDLKYQYKDTLNNSNLTVNNSNETAGDIIVISSSQDNQSSVDAYINDKSQGAATWGFLKALNDDLKPTWENLINNMRTVINGGGYSQVTQLSSGRAIDIKTPIPL